MTEQGETSLSKIADIIWARLEGKLEAIGAEIRALSATVSTELRSLGRSVDENRNRIEDHEKRIRQLENGNARVAVVGVLGMMVLSGFFAYIVRLLT